MKHLVLFLSFFLCSFSSFAKLEVTQSKKFLYYKIPYKELMEQEKEDLIEQAVRVSVQEIRQRIPERRLTKKMVEALDKLEKDIVPLLDQIKKAAKEKSEIGSIHLRDALPTALEVYIGGSWFMKYMVGGGAGMAIGMIIMPYKVYRINKITKEVTQYYEFQYSWTGFIEFSASMGIGVGPSFFAGIASIWGQLDHPSDFRGLLFSFNMAAFCGVGANVMLGILNRMKMKGLFNNPYIAAGVVAGPVCPAGYLGGKTTIIVDASKLFQTLGLSNTKSGQKIERPVPEEYQNNPEDMGLSVDEDLLNPDIPGGDIDQLTRDEDEIEDNELREE